MWEKFAATHRSHDTVHAQWLQTHCQWYPMVTGKMRTYGRADFLDLKMTKPNYKPNTGPNSNPNANPNTTQILILI